MNYYLKKNIECCLFSICFLLLIKSLRDSRLQYVAHNRGIFSWELIFHWGPVPQKEQERRKADSDPIKSPTMAGGLFAMTRYVLVFISLEQEGLLWETL